jgi:hypothetical protein
MSKDVNHETYLQGKHRQHSNHYVTYAKQNTNDYPLWRGNWRN